VVRLIATDLDGTLLRADSSVSERTRRALRAVEALGVRVVLVTGRPPRMARLVARDAGTAGLVICCNGALVCQADGETVVRHSPLSPAAAAELVAAMRAAAPGVCFAAEIATRHAQERAFAALAAAARSALTVPVEWDGPVLHEDALAFCAEPLTKLIARHPSLPLDELERLLRAAVGDAATLTLSGGPFVEISAAGVHKAHALAALCADLAIDAADVVAFGDMPNDLPMLAWAGRAVAVANAHPDVVASADELTASNEEDGVAAYLERHLLSGVRQPAPSHARSAAARPGRPARGRARPARPPSSG